MVYAFVSVGHRHVSCLRVLDTPSFMWQKCPTYQKKKEEKQIAPKSG